MMNKLVKPAVYDYSARRKVIDSLCAEYEFIKRSVIGRSCGGRDIYALKIGSAAEYSLIAAAFHGSEHITSVVLLMFIEELAAAVKSGGYLCGLNAARALGDRGVIFIPCVNPDGCEISINGINACGELGSTVKRLCLGDFEHWNANLRGVDINHNFNADWKNLKNKEIKAGIFGPSPTRFGGYRPESEPETLALTELCRTGFTIELGLGKNPLPAADAAKIYERVKEMLMLFIMM